MATECEAEFRNKRAIHQLQIDLGNGVFNATELLKILRGQGDEPCAA